MARTHHTALVSNEFENTPNSPTADSDDEEEGASNIHHDLPHPGVSSRLSGLAVERQAGTDLCYTLLLRKLQVTRLL